MSIETEGCSGRTRPAIDGAPAETRKAPNVDNFRIALAQVNTIVGDLRGNTELIKGWIDRASALGADLAAFPELTLTGYPPEDLVLYPSFVAENKNCSDSWPVRSTRRGHRGVRRRSGRAFI